MIYPKKFQKYYLIVNFKQKLAKEINNIIIYLFEYIIFYLLPQNYAKCKKYFL